MTLPGEDLPPRSGATRTPLHHDPAELLAERKRQAAQTPWGDATPLVRDAGQAYREVMGARRQQEQAPEQQRLQPQRSTPL